MRTHRSTTILSVCLFLLFSAGAITAWGQTQPRPIELADIMAWKGISGTALSENGEWFAYRMGPAEGDSEVIIRQTKGDKEFKFSVGEIPQPPAIFGPGDLANLPVTGPAVAFSSDGKYAVFTMFPSRSEAAQLKKQRKPIQNKVGIVNLGTGEKIEIAKVRRFTLSGENGGWIAMHKYGPDAPAGAPPTAPPAAGAGPARDDRPKGSDLILRELSSGQEINIGNVADFAFDKKGRYLAWTIDAQDKAGNGVAIREMENGAIRPLDNDSKAVYSRLTWTEEGNGLTALKGIDDKAYEDKLYSVLGFKDFGPGGPQKTVFNPMENVEFPIGMTVSPNRSATWTKDLSALLFGINKAKKKEKSEGEKGDGPSAGDTSADEKVDLVLWHWKDKRLQSQQQVQESSDKNYSYLAIYRPAEKKFVRLADDLTRQVTPAPEQKYAIGRSDDQYELMSHLDGRSFADISVINLQTGERKVALTKARWTMGSSPTGTHFVYYNDGQYYAYDMASGQSTSLTKSIPSSFVDAENDVNVVKPPTPFVGWAKDGKSVLLSDNWDIWQVPIGGGPAVNLTVNGKTDQIRYRRPQILDPEQRGFDLTKPLYLDVYSEWTKKDGIGMIEPGKPGVKRLMWDEASYSGMIKAKKADVYLYTRQTYKDPPDYYVTDASLANGKRLTNLGAGQEKFLWSSGTILVDYTSAKGDKLQGALHLPANYEKGKTYPMMVNFYEKTSQSAYQYARPSANGFNTSVYTSNGYAVFNPDITYKLNDPGMSAVWCMVPAVKAAIATGVVDPKRVGITGHSWGGYQTAFLVTQTDIFAAAIAGAPLTDLISMYGLIYKNSGVTNGEIFESSQGRFTSGPWDNWEAYTRNSPVAFAKNVKTPLVILHNDKDGAVDFTQGVEYYNTLRRLQKPVVMLEYIGENHGLAKRANQKDYTVRMKEFFDHFLMGKPMPKWYEEGVQRLQMDDHLRTRLQPAKPPAAQAGQSAEAKEKQNEK
ncbi:MAG TPA: prolyl oligopeptidase family serine peptidase [Pyrinomonadaceae bacterium]|nr:prolyl oligopeptidase family serine peptidase [Pyrinomonadaceae bacterium]